MQSCNRAIVLFGRNAASYKFALAKTLLELNAQSGQLLKLGELRKTLMAQTGRDAAARRDFLNHFYARDSAVLLHAWVPAKKCPALF